MEKQAEHTAIVSQFHVRFPACLLAWLRGEAKKNRRSITAEIVIAVEYWKKTREIAS
jgi:hypothetical protein